MNDLRPSRISRARFLKLVGGTSMLVLAGRNAYAQTAAQARNGDFIFLQAVQFDDLGGWDVDQQSMEQMGSAYLLAHGLGVPVNDAVTTPTISAPGTYRVWVRTRDWVAPWNAPGAPGKFQLLIDDKPLPVTFGTEGADWHWQDGGTVQLGAKPKIALHDLTGFEGRCDAVLFARDATFQPPNELVALTRFRRAALGLPDAPEDGGTFDLVVVGGGIAGTSAAVSAARNGLKVALVQDRPVLGGNGSSEVRVLPAGNTRVQPYPHIGEIVLEIVPPNEAGAGNGKGAKVYDDARKTAVVQAEPRITLLMEQRVFSVEAAGGHVNAVVAEHIVTGKRLRLAAKFFADCTGDATVGFLAGADYEISREDHQGMSNLWNLMNAADPKQVLKCECKDKTALAMATEAGNVAEPFPHCPWAIDLSDKPFPGRPLNKKSAKPELDKLGGWYWESGFDRDPITDVERIRDLNLRAMYGAWDALKNVDHLYPNFRIGWAAFIAGKRESRRLMGDVVVAVDDFLTNRAFEDGCFPCSWGIDLHTPDKAYQAGNEGNEFISTYTHGGKFTYKGPYWAPYRALYSRNMDNLFMAGRDISVTHEGLGPVRVMKTCGMMGEIVGKAASICVSQNTSPRGVYQDHLDALKGLMAQPGATRQA